jgi:hypothetical protein
MCDAQKSTPHPRKAKKMRRKTTSPCDERRKKPKPVLVVVTKFLHMYKRKEEKGRSVSWKSLRAYNKKHRRAASPAREAFSDACHTKCAPSYLPQPRTKIYESRRDEIRRRFVAGRISSLSLSLSVVTSRMRMRMRRCFCLPAARAPPPVPHFLVHVGAPQHARDKAREPAVGCEGARHAVAAHVAFESSKL